VEVVSNVAAKRRRWVASIRSDLEALVSARSKHDRAHDIVARHDPVLAEYLDLLRSQMLALGIRRQLKMDSRSITVAGLIADLVARPDGGEPLATGIVRDDRVHGGPIEELRGALRVVKTRAQSAESYADRSLAHADRRTPAVPTRDELEATLDTVVELFEKAASIVEGSAFR
jgi:hypothetical protein